ncbi:hypothetical protein [Streptomyces chrestomyceticus]|uniref:hypothetical protein n=1 Tax=Streptomyces chrestomyceticus TaxID=68185 RepID=UPI0004C63559
MAQTFVELADTFADNFAVTAFLQRLRTRCQGLLDIPAATTLLALPGRPPRPVALPPAPAALLDTLVRDGPARQCWRTGAPLTGLYLPDQQDC